MIKDYQIELLAIGNGTASRETEQFVANVIKKYSLDAQFIIVNEAEHQFTQLQKLLDRSFLIFK